MGIIIPTNKYQTHITDDLKKSLKKEVWEQLIEYISSVKAIKSLIAPEKERGYAKMLPVLKKEIGKDDFGNSIYEYDKEGRKEINLTAPHILEDMNFFRERAIFFEETGKYTNIPVNPNPKSEYAEFWKEELRRWKYGLVRPSDGEWIPGSYYFYLNYSPIWLNEVVNESGSGKKQGKRIRKFPKVWLGDYLFFHYIDLAERRGRHGKALKTRGIGMSFKFASMSPRNMYVKPGLPNFHLASDKGFLSGDKGIFGKIMDVLDWIADNTPLEKIRLINSHRSMEIQLGYLDKYGARKGNGASVMGISLKDNPDKVRGIRGPLIHYEEDGLFPNLEKAWNVNRKAVEDGDIVYGIMVAAGTGGVSGGSFIGSEKLFYKPLAYNILGIPNVFDKNTNGDTKCGFFWGAYLNRAECYDDVNGEPDVVKALIQILNDRYIVKYASSDPLAITQKKAEEPITPSEAILRTTGTVFPVSDIKEHLEKIKVNEERFLSSHYYGEFVYDSKGAVKWKMGTDKMPLRSYNLTSQNREGGVEIFEMPKRNHNGDVISNRYIFGIDTIDSDEGDSLFSIIGFDTFTDKIVVEYTGRPRLANSAYEIALKMLLFYNGRAMYERNLKGLFTYFSNKNMLYLLADTPQILRDMDMVKGVGIGNNAKGVHATAPINSWGRKLQADWMSSRVNPDDKEDMILNLHNIRSIPYLEEALYWNKDGNFDRISAGSMVFIYREEILRLIKSNKENMDKVVKSLADDSFFLKNYDNKVGNSYKAMQQNYKFYNNNNTY